MLLYIPLYYPIETKRMPPKNKTCTANMIEIIIIQRYFGSSLYFVFQVHNISFTSVTQGYEFISDITSHSIMDLHLLLMWIRSCCAYWIWHLVSTLNIKRTIADYTGPQATSLLKESLFPCTIIMCVCEHNIANEHLCRGQNDNHPWLSAALLCIYSVRCTCSSITSPIALSLRPDRGRAVNQSFTLLCPISPSWWILMGTCLALQRWRAGRGLWELHWRPQPQTARNL